jgi:adenylate kinase family enzyme
MRRVLIVGSGGAGKSTLAARLAERLGLPLICLDALFWHAGWVETPKAEWVARVAEASARDAWVMDGNYGGTIDMRLARCDTVIFLDMPRLVCMAGVVSRWVKYRGRTRPDMAAGCQERLNWEFLTWVWTYPARRRGEILAKLDAVAHEKAIIVLRSRAAVRSFLDGLAVDARSLV